MIEIPLIEKTNTIERVIVMGGSFNPPTLAHQRLLLAAVEASGAEYGVFVPSNHAYVAIKMKRAGRKDEVLSEDTRLAMLETMCTEDQRLRTDICEYGRDLKAKTYETMETIQEKYPHAELWFIAGGDKLSVIPRWHRNREFLQKFHILVVARNGENLEGVFAENPFLMEHSEMFCLLREPDGVAGISSTCVRDKLRNGDGSAAEMVHPEVWELLLKEGWLKMDITSFRGDYDFLSNFYEAPVEYDGLIYGNNEAAFQAQKCMTAEEKQIFTECRPSKAKSKGRQVQLRPDWEDVKVGIMEEIVRAKFRQNPILASWLLATGDRKLIEGNTWHDVCWGVDAKTGEGENHLGKILMKIRDELRNN